MKFPSVIALLALMPIPSLPVSIASPARAAGPAQAALEPFVATYEVFHHGRALGNATMQVVRAEGTRWRIDLTMKGSGLMRLTGLNLQQSTVFDADGRDYRPLSQAMVRRAVFAGRKTTGVYDWNALSARWSGNVRPARRAPVPLQPGDMSGLLINLAVIRDAAPGKNLRYRFVDDGRARDHAYTVAPETETVQVGDISYDAMRVARTQDGAEETVLWVAAGVPTPIRILQRENGKDTTDLRLIEYKGAQP